MKIFAKKNELGKSVRKQIVLVLIGFLLIVGIIFSAGYIGLTSLQKNNAQFQQVVHSNDEKLYQLYIMSTVVRERMLIVYDIAHTQDAFDKDDLFMKASNQVQKFILARQKLFTLSVTVEQKMQLEEQRKLLNHSQSLINQIIEQVLATDEIDNHIMSVISEARKANGYVLTSLTEMQDNQRRKALYEFELAEKSTIKAIERVISLAILAFIFSSIVIGFIIRHMKRQNLALNNALFDLKEANEDLEERVKNRTAALMASKSENIRMTAELDLGRHLQEVILPNKKELRQNKHLDISVFIEPADEMGGDYYDVLNVNDHTYIGIGDVTGHGLESGIIMLMTQSAVKTQIAGDNIQIESVLSHVNKTIFENVQRMDSAKHLSLVLLDYYREGSQGKLKVCGQHETVFVVRADGGIKEVDTDKLGFPIGLIDSIKMFIGSERLTLNQDDILVLYTDGITEAENIQKEFYGIRRLKDKVFEFKDESAEVIKTEVIRDLYAFIGKQKIYDDITLLIMKQLA